MNIMKRFLRLITYILICLFCFLLIRYQQNRITKKRNAEVVSIINEWQKHGKPVKTMKVEKQDFPQFSKFTIMAANNNEYISYVTGNTAKNLRPGQNVYGTMDRRHILGQITFVDNKITFDKGLYQVKIKNQDISNKDHKNLVVFVHIATHKNVIWVPLDAVDFTKTGDDVNFFVWTVNDNKVHKQPVKEGKISATGIEIKEGIDEGAVIVINGKTALHENDDVYIIGDMNK